jgi:hypothetical protein
MLLSDLKQKSHVFSDLFQSERKITLLSESGEKFAANTP